MDRGADRRGHFMERVGILGREDHLDGSFRTVERNFDALGVVGLADGIAQGAKGLGSTTAQRVDSRDTARRDTGNLGHHRLGNLRVPTDHQRQSPGRLQRTCLSLSSAHHSHLFLAGT